MSWLYFLDRLGSEFSVWYVSFLWHSLLVYTGLSLVLFGYRKHSARVKCTVWIVSIPMMLVMPSLSRLAIKSNMPLYKVDVQSVQAPETILAENVVAGTIHDSVKPEQSPDYPSPRALFPALYGIAVMGMTGFFLAGRRTVRRVVLDATPFLNTTVLALVESCSRNLNISRTVLVLESDKIPVPFTSGLLHPVIVLPSGLFSRISADEKQHIILHELSHIKSHDSALLGLTAIARVLLFLNPFVWFSVSKITTLAEESCDELVVEHFGEPVQYARTLTSIAETVRNKSFGLEYAAGFVFSRRVFLRRIKSILSMRNHTIVKLSRSATMMLVILMGALAVSIVSFPVTSRAIKLYDGSSTLSRLESLRDKASTGEKREAIENIIVCFQKYNRHIIPAVECSELILDADRNIPVIEKLAEYAITNGSETIVYIRIAEYAAKSEIASDEFLEIAGLVQTYGCEAQTMVNLAKKASRAGSESKLEHVRADIRKLGSRLAMMPKPERTSVTAPAVPFMTMADIETKKEQAQTAEKREAIERIQKLLKKYDRHYSVTRCIDLILETDRNVEVIGKIAEYGVTVPYCTMAFVEIAECAAKAPVADDEFLELAELLKKRGDGAPVQLARQASQASNETELKQVKRKIKALKNDISALPGMMIAGFFSLIDRSVQ
ncbi:M56 family metallopeptidase [bacterium]|nr:M56 family metallopeptidase [bacterium]